MGELGTEILVRNGQYQTIGDNGAEFIDVKKDDIIFNHKQTEQILKYGHINSRGQARATGSAFSGTESVTGAGDSGWNSSSTSSSKKKNSKKSTTTTTFFDWIERRIAKFQRQFDKWLNRAETAITSGFIEKYYKKAASNSKSLMSTYDKAYERYIKQANKSGLSSKYKKLVQNGKIYISTITNDKLKEKIQDYQNWYDNMPHCLAISNENQFNCWDILKIVILQRRYEIKSNVNVTKVEKITIWHMV